MSTDALGVENIAPSATSFGDERRVFKTKTFARAARKAKVGDHQLCEAIGQVWLGQADDLGGGVFKKRLDSNRQRSIIVAAVGRWWIYEYLFAKQDRENIEDDELKAFRQLSKGYAGLSDRQLQQLLDDRDLVEICRGQED